MPVRPARFAVLALAAAALVALAAWERPPPKVETARAPVVEPPPPAAPRPVVRAFEVERGDNLGRILSRAGLEASEGAAVIAAARAVADPGRLSVGQTIELTFDPGGASLETMRMPLDPERAVRVDRGGGGFVARVEVSHFTDEVQPIAGVIRGSLWDAAREAGLPAEQVSRLAEVFDCRIDFNTELHPGDHFRLLAVRRVAAGGGSRFVGLAAAEVTSGGKAVRALRFIDGEGRPAWFAEDGEGMARAYLKSPLPFHAVGSGYTLRRFHPILHKVRPHWGQDYGAPTGTPVRAVAAGRVATVGTKGGYGRHVRVVHDGRYGSSYSHLSRYARGLRAGSPVERGQVLGYVGSTGLSTSPHLHFEFYDRGRPVDYARVRVPRGEELHPAARPAFDAVRAQVLPRLAAVALPGSAPEAEIWAETSRLAAGPTL